MFSAKLNRGLTRVSRRLLLAWGLGCAFAAHGQWLTQQDPDWKEAEVSPPSRTTFDQLLPLEMPSYVNLKFGIDPHTVSVGPDGVVRYVVVAQSASGARSVMFEGINCYRWEFKTYARMGPDNRWTPLPNAPWRLIDNSIGSTRHALAFARQAACSGGAATSDKAHEIVRVLKTGR
jgi:hypothetical protein